MTFEHRIVCGIEEVKAITLECKECKARVSLNPANTMRPPDKCPNGHAWDWNVYLGYNSTESPFVALFSSLKKLADPALKEIGFRLFFEFEKPKE
jgi:hypothetical protein